MKETTRKFGLIRSYNLPIDCIFVAKINLKIDQDYSKKNSVTQK